jgi:putative transposase
MAYQLRMHNRHSLRLPGYDYSWPGLYYVTICTYHRYHIFGKVIDGQMHLSVFGEIVKEEWLRSASIRKELYLDAYQIMPHHIHGIVGIMGTKMMLCSEVSGGATGQSPPPDPISPPDPMFPPRTTFINVHSPTMNTRPNGPGKRSLSSFIAGFKAAVTVRINALRNSPSMPVWQRNYYEHIVRDIDDLIRIRAYIRENPEKWTKDTNTNMV